MKYDRMNYAQWNMANWIMALKYGIYGALKHSNIRIAGLIDDVDKMAYPIYVRQYHPAEGLVRASTALEI